MRKLAVGFCLSLLFSLPAPAALIAHDLLAPGDALMTYDSDTNLEWLDLTLTKNQSYTGVEASIYFTNHGFRHATTDEVTTLFENAGGTVNTPFNAANLAPAQLLLGLMGCTDTAAFCGAGPVGTGSGWAQNLADLTLAYTPSYAVTQLGTLGRFVTPGGSGGFGTKVSTTGNYLVRVFVPVPEPGTALLLGLGFAAVAIRARRKRA